ncbi:unnamed protein product [Effrenium voratum]|uniref:Uncharacterized protein n=1 Tax=Effrenium voratum TaxID=2562239 RepID=A0AA36HMH8_9DINO|nr:unnamed protein product [Effrenium voratum]
MTPDVAFPARQCRGSPGPPLKLPCAPGRPPATGRPRANRCDSWLPARGGEVLTFLTRLSNLLANGEVLEFICPAASATRVLWSGGQQGSPLPPAHSQSGNFEVLKSPVGVRDFCEAFSAGTARKHGAITASIASLPDPRRPTSACSDLPGWQDGPPMPDNARGAVWPWPGTLVPQPGTLSVALCFQDRQWEQVALPARDGGVGFRPSVTMADVAYLGSRVLGVAAWPAFHWDAALPRELSGAGSGAVQCPAGLASRVSV